MPKGEEQRKCAKKQEKKRTDDPLDVYKNLPCMRQPAENTPLELLEEAPKNSRCEAFTPTTDNGAPAVFCSVGTGLGCNPGRFSLIEVRKCPGAGWIKPLLYMDTEQEAQEK
ncbi:MAG: hypothetical protein JWN64_42 [Parcubacteria group bacterium]|nr:hypothetical protein [Parcubacteria group bacterium]